MMWMDRALSKKEVLMLFFLLSVVYIYPIVHADYAYVDDNWRSLLGAEEGWRNQGRVFIEVFFQCMTFGSSTTNMFPFPLLLSICFLVVAMARLTHWYFAAPSVASCLVVLPILCNPFFLGNLSYQYDGAAMVLAVVAVIYAITCRVESPGKRSLAVALLLVATLSLYQLTVALFVGLCVVEFYLGVKAKRAVNDVLLSLAHRLGQLVAAGLIYYCSVYQMAVDTRGNLYPFDDHWWSEVIRKLLFSMGKIKMLITPGNLALWVLLSGIAVAGFVVFMGHIYHMKGTRLGRGVMGGLYLLGVPIMVLMVPGIMLFLKEPNLDARNYIAFSVILIFLFFLNYEMLGRLHVRLRLLLVIPVLLMFSLCYAYGQVIIAKKEFEMALANYVGYDLISNEDLKSVRKFYFTEPAVGGNWLPRGHAAMTYMPVLRYILSGANTLLHPQFLTRVGINNVVATGEQAVNAVAMARTEKPVIDRKFYSIYLRAGDGVIVMKDFVEAEEYSHY